MDALLAYAFLWKGRRVPQVMTRSQLGQEVEDFVNRLLRAHSVDTQIIFNAKDACDKLEAMGLFQRYGTVPTETWLQVVNMDTAMQRLSSVDVSKKYKQGSLTERVTTEFDEVNFDVSLPRV